jgi:hypothetical protein
VVKIEFGVPGEVNPVATFEGSTEQNLGSTIEVFR